MTDTHTHPYLEEFEDGGEEAVNRAIHSGVGHMVFPNVNAATIEPMMALHRRFPENTSVAMGLHPTEVDEHWEQVVDSMESLLSEGQYAAVGEVGLDLYWDASRRDDQIAAFARQLDMAQKIGLPVIIHCREALDETLEVIEKVKPTVPLIFHSFTGSEDDVRKIRKVCDPMFGINGVVTFKNAAQLRDALSEIGIGRILLETDAPYLAPVPHRGRRNEPAYLTDICRKVAETLEMGEDEVEKITDQNAKLIFKI